jgi:regulator of sigma E protease
VGIPIKQFSIGFGPKLFGFIYKNTEYRISVFPIGGYVMPELDQLDDYFVFSLKSRILFSLAGPLFNIIAAWAGLLIMNLIGNGVDARSILVAPFEQLWSMTAQFIGALPMIFSDPKQLSGIIGLVAFGKEIGIDIQRLLSLSVLLNINLAFLNLLPVLPLDGGKILIDLLDRLRMPVKRLYVPVAIAGWAILLMLMVYVTINDVSKLFACA